MVCHQITYNRMLQIKHLEVQTNHPTIFRVQILSFHTTTMNIIETLHLQREDNACRLGMEILELVLLFKQHNLKWEPIPMLFIHPLHSIKQLGTQRSRHHMKTSIITTNNLGNKNIVIISIHISSNTPQVRLNRGVLES